MAVTRLSNWPIRFIRRMVRLLAWPLLFTISGAELNAQAADEADAHRHQVETYPIMALFRVYSVQYAYGVSSKTELIVGLAYVNVDVRDKADDVIGQLNAPTLPLGLRRYLWRNAHLEYQLWPAYNFYYDRVGERYHNGFDLYNEFRGGYRIDFSLGGLPMFTNLQYVYGFGIYPGKKPDNFMQAVEDAPPFHVPSISVGVRF